MITFATLAADTVPAAALNADAAGAVSADGAGEFGNVLQQLMGATSNAGIDLPLDYEGDETGDEADRDELVNANVIDPGVQPLMRLMPAATWIVAEVPAAAVPVVVDSESAAERSVSAAAMLGSPMVGIDTPAPVASKLSTAFDAVVADGEAPPAVESPVVEASPGAAVSEAPTAGRVHAAVPRPTPSEAVAHAPLVQGIDTPVAPSATTGRESTTTPPPEAAPRDAAPVTATARRGADKHDPARMTIEAGQRAYAAAAFEGSKQDTHNGPGDGRHDSRANLDAVPPTPSASSPESVVVQGLADRPVGLVTAKVAPAIVVAAEAVEAAVATELPAQVVQSIRMQAIDGGGEAIVRLRPEYLGELVVAVKVEHGAVTAALQSDTPAVRKWVEGNEATLRQALAEHGLHLERLTISDEAPSAETGERDRQEQPEHEGRSHSQSRRQRKPAPDATFEVDV